MLFGFSTMGDPALSFMQAEQLARRFGLDFIEIRVLEHTLDLPEYFRASQSSPASAGHLVRVVSSSFCLHEAEEKDMQDLLRYAVLADQLNAPYVRIFGAKEWTDSLTSSDLRRKAATIKSLRERFSHEGIRCEILLETHDVFSCSDRCIALNACLDTPIAILWDSHITWLAGESPEETWHALGPWVRHIHYNDSVSSKTEKDGLSYRFPGDGEYPTAGLIKLLNKAGYAGGISLEWEKLWNPELPALQLALPKFAAISNSWRMMEELTPQPTPSQQA